MDNISKYVNPKESFSGKLFLLLLSVAFVFLSLAGLLSNYFYQSTLELELKTKSQTHHELLKEEILGILSYVEKSQTELANSSVLELAIKTKDYSGLLPYVARYKLGSVNLFDKEGAAIFSLSRSGDSSFSFDQQAVEAGMKLPVDAMKILLEKNVNLQIYENQILVEFVRQIRFQLVDQVFTLELVAPVRKSYFQKLSKQVLSMFYLKNGSNLAFSTPNSLKNFLVSEVPSSEEVVEFQGESYSFTESRISEESSIRLGSFVNVDSLVSSIGKLHLRIFLVCLIAFLVLSPILLFLSNWLSKPITNILRKTTDLRRKNTLNLLPVHSNDELGQIVGFMNDMFTRLNDFEQESQARALENIVVKQKNDNLKSDYSRLVKDYLNSRMFRRNLESLVSGLNYSQSYSLNMNKLLVHFKELVDYLEESGQNQGFIRKHDLRKRVQDTFGSGENVASATARQSEILIDQLWLVDKANPEEELSVVASRCVRLFSAIFPQLKTKVDIASIESLDIDREHFKNLLSLLMFYVAKQSRDGNSIHLKVESVQDKQFQAFKALIIEMETPVSFEAEVLDGEGQTLLRMIELSVNQLSWQMIFPLKDRARVSKLYLQMELEL